MFARSGPQAGHSSVRIQTKVVQKKKKKNPKSGLIMSCFVVRKLTDTSARTVNNRKLE